MNNENKELLSEELEKEESQGQETVEETHELEEDNVPTEEEYVGKEVTTSIRYDYRTMKYFNMYNTVVKRKLPIWYLVMGIAAIAFAAYNLITGLIAYEENPELSLTSTYIFSLIFAFFAIYLINQGLKFENLIDRTITNHFLTHKVASQNIRIREDKITLIPVNKPEESFSYDWLQVTSIEEIDEYFYLYIGKSPLIIDKDPNKMVEGTFEELEEIINDKIEFKPYKRCTKKFVKKPITFVHQEDIEAQEQALEADVIEEEKPEEND